MKTAEIKNNKLWTTWVILGAFINALGVLLGAFGTHFLKGRLRPEELSIYETAIRYLLIHATALLLLGILRALLPKNQSLRLSGWLFFAGIIIFSGSLFLLIATKITFFGAITPLGGLCFIGAWVALIIAIFKERYR